MVLQGEFIGDAKIQRVMLNMAQIRLNLEDLSNPVSFQLAMSRIYENLMKALEGGIKYSYVAEIKFKDSLGNQIVFALDLGDKIPAISSEKLKARIYVELYEDQEGSN
ncbi:MAG: hypothetical protein QXH99_03200 [Sulfolobales archaeon]|jgi:hypothetical protein